MGYTPGDYVVITFSDTGCGMDEVTLEHLFEPFFTTKEVGLGTGLGLATVHGIVKQLGGMITVESKPWQGTRFTIYWPRCPDPVAPPVAVATAAPAQRGNQSILLVEDDPSVRAITHRFLADLGYTVLAAGSPEEALRQAAQHAGTIHLLITDVVMPRMNGRDLAVRLSHVRPSIKCLFMSGYSADVLALRGVLDETMQLLSKPFLRETLAAKVREVLNA